jgi:hypothetical protein
MSGEIEKRLNAISKDLTANHLAEKAYPVFVRGEGTFKGTPIDTGNARNNTKLSKDSILAQYPYAQRLNQGYSKQAPDGMSKPTDDYIKKYIANYSKKG